MIKLKENVRLKLDIRKQGINGEGIAYYNRMAIFVPGAIRKEVVEVEITKVLDHYAEAKVLSIIRPSKKRVQPRSSSVKGSQTYQLEHIEYKEQLKIKQLIIEQTMKRFSSLENVKGLVDKTLHGSLEWGYQNQAVYRFVNHNFGLTLAVYNPIENDFVEVKENLLVNQEINQIANLAIDKLKAYKLKAYDTRNQEGQLLYLLIRYVKETDSASVVFVLNEKSRGIEKVAEDMIHRFQSIQSIGYCLHHRSSHKLLANPVHILAGKDTIKALFHGEEIEVSPRGVFPKNQEVFELVDELILKETGLTKTDQLLNLYQYSTLSSLYFAAHVKKVVSVDYFDASINDAKTNQLLLKRKNIQWVASHVESTLKELLSQDIQVLNIYAPKNGCGFKVFNLIQKYVPKQVVYISENPSAMAKDVDQLLNLYRVKKIVPVDALPQTAAIESVIFLERK